MSPEDAMERLNGILAHAWMVRTFLKHADEIQEDEGMLDVPRTLYDSIRAVEPAFERARRRRIPSQVEREVVEIPQARPSTTTPTSASSRRIPISKWRGCR